MPVTAAAGCKVNICDVGVRFTMALTAGSSTKLVRNQLSQEVEEEGKQSNGEMLLQIPSVKSRKDMGMVSQRGNG